MTQFDPSSDAFYAAVTGGKLPGKRFDVAEGVALQPAYAHVFASYMVAFKRPEASGEHHPGPWHPAGNDVGFDCEFEIFVDRGAQAGTVGRLNVGWLCAAMLRLRSGLKLRVPVISNTSFADPSFYGPQSSVILPMETSSTQRPPKETVACTVEADDLTWLRDRYASALNLMKDPIFATAFVTYDGAAWQPSVPAGTLALCSALEALMRPGRRDMTKRLARVVAAYLTDEPVLRSLHHQTVLDLFGHRGAAAHAAKWLPIEIWHAAQLLVRPTFIQCLDDGKLPDPEALDRSWGLVGQETLQQG